MTGAPRDGEIVTEAELAALDDDTLIELLVQRSSLDLEAAREALEIIRGGLGDLIELS